MLGTYIGAVVLLAVVGYIAWKLFWFITENRREEGSYYKDATRKGFLRKELVRNIVVTILIIAGVIGASFLWGAINDGGGEDVEEVSDIVEDEDDETAVYWETRYKIPKGVMEQVDSSAISEMGYDSKNRAVIVRFKSSGKAYVYIDVPRTVWESFRNAKSIGSYYNKNIKGKYKSYRMVGQ